MGKTIEQIVSVLTEGQKQLLKDTIRFGSWGDGTYNFINEKGDVECCWMMGYCTNDAKLAGNFTGRQISAMFRAIYKKMCPDHGTGEVISHCSDWWDDGSGDMLFIKEGYVEDFESWANE